MDHDRGREIVSLAKAFEAEELPPVDPYPWERPQPPASSLPIMGAELADQLIWKRRLEEPQEWGRKCYPGTGWPRAAFPVHDYVRGIFGVFNSGGTLTAVLVCKRCGRGRQAVPHRELAKHDILPAELPLLADLRRDACERCGALGAQLHHMAPRSRFEDADDWPTAYLCQTCHAKWHKAMGTR